jgi:PhnB protein
MVKAIPALVVKNAKESLKVYEDLFGAKTTNWTPASKDMAGQMNLPEDFDFDNSTMHAEFKIGDALFYINDSMGKKELVPEGNVEIVLELDSKEQIDAIWEKVKQGDYKIKQELEKTFWNAYFGMFVDGDGIGWQLNFPLPAPSPETPAAKPAPVKNAPKAKPAPAKKAAKPTKAKKK